MLGHSVNLTGRTGSAMQRMTAHLPYETLTKSDVSRIVNEMKILGMGASARHALQVSLSHVNEARAANKNHGVFSSAPVIVAAPSSLLKASDANRRLGELMTQLKFAGRIVPALFLVLWDAKPELLSSSEIKKRWRELASPAEAENVVVRYIAKVRQEIRERSWPLSISGTPSEGYRLVVEEDGFDWEDKLSDLTPAQSLGADRTLRSYRSFFRKTATPALLDYLLKKEGQVLSGADMRNVVIESTGDRKAGLSYPVAAVRRLIREECLPFELQAVREVGYRLVRNAGPSQTDASPPTAVGLNSDEQERGLESKDASHLTETELFSNERLAELMNTLGHTCDPRSGRILLILWCMGGRTILYDKLDYMLSDMMLSERCHRSLVYATCLARQETAAAGWPVEITSKRNVGLRLTRSNPCWSWESNGDDTYGVLIPQKLGDLDAWTIDERIALLSDIFPGTTARTVRMLFLLLENRRRLLSYHIIQGLWHDAFREEISRTSVANYLVRSRLALRKSDFAIEIQTEKGIGIWVIMAAMPSQLSPLFRFHGGSHVTGA